MNFCFMWFICFSREGIYRGKGKVRMGCEGERGLGGSRKKVEGEEGSWFFVWRRKYSWLVI